MKFKEHLRLKDDANNICSHDVIVGEVNLPISKEESTTLDFSSTYTPFIVKKPKWNVSGLEGYQIQTERILLELTDSYDKLEFIPVLSEMFAKALVLSAENNFEQLFQNQRRM